MGYMFDTNICIYLINSKHPAIIIKIESQGIENISVSTITIAELEFGISKSKSEKKQQNREALIEFLLPFHIIDFSQNDAFEYGRIRADLQNKGSLIGNMDLLLGAQALARGLTIVTNNEREFKRITELKIENWTE